VVIIDVGITHRIDLQVDQAMAADLMEHVIQEGHTGAGVTLATAVEIQADLDIGFASDSMDLTRTHAVQLRKRQRRCSDHAETDGADQGPSSQRHMPLMQ
jgi:hypothetical protein